MAQVDLGARLMDRPSGLQPQRTTRTQTLLAAARAALHRPPKSVLVVGCGDGTEAGVLARTLDAQTTGIDIGAEFAFDHEAAAPAHLLEMDAQHLAFPDASFDLVYSFHALEHIQDPQLALHEMARVLRPGGGFIIGTPNKTRLLGYVGSAATLSEKLRWNCADWRMRLQGRWSNAAGAHAGFTEPELTALCQQAFGDAQPITRSYYRALYANAPRALRLLTWTGTETLMFPAVYVVGTKRPRS